MARKNRKQFDIRKGLFIPEEVLQAEKRKRELRELLGINTVDYFDEVNDTTEDISNEQFIQIQHIYTSIENYIDDLYKANELIIKNKEVPQDMCNKLHAIKEILAKLNLKVSIM